MQQKPLHHKLVGLSLCILLMSACSSSDKKENLSPAEYDLNHPYVVKLPDKLNEISGIVYYPKDSSIFAIVDENGVLFKILLKENIDVQQWKFGKSRDFEDLVLVDSVFYALQSKGDIVAFKFLTPDSLVSETFSFPISGRNEFEVLYYDTVTTKLVMICKDCEADKKSTVSTWTFDPVTHSYDEGPFTINATNITNRNTKKQKFKPSAAAFHPLTGELYIISSINKLLVVADRKGKVKKVYQLDADVFKQPEGITFTPSGNLIISNESAAEGLPNLLFYKYKKNS